MMEHSFTPTERRYPILYWTTLAYLVGVPNFVHFDVTGRTGNPINLTSIGTIVLACIAGYLLVALMLLDRRPLMVRKINIKTWLWIALVAELLLAIVFQPASRLIPPTTTGLILSLFRIGQWVLAFSLIVALYTRTAPEHATEFVVRLIGRASWVWLALVWLILPIMPEQVYGGSEDMDAQAIRRLGGQLLHPAHVALLSSIALFYGVLFFRRGPLKWIALLLPLVSIVLTGARAQQAGFLLAMFLYVIVFSPKPAVRWGALFLGFIGLIMGVALSEKVMKFIGRGQSLQTLSSLNDRTRIWKASFEAIAERPLIGYGYSVGARGAIRDHWNFAHWIPPHAHNEFIETALDGGIIALGIVLFLYGWVFYKAIKSAKRGPMHMFLFLVFGQYCLNTFTGSELSYQYLGTGGVLLLCCIGILAGAPDKMPVREAFRQKANASLDYSMETSAV